MPEGILKNPGPHPAHDKGKPPAAEETEEERKKREDREKREQEEEERRQLEAERAVARAETIEQERQERVRTAKIHRERWSYRLIYYDPHGGMVRRYTLRYYHVDDSIEILDRSRGVVFFPRLIYPAVHIDDLRLGREVVVWRRRLHIVGYADEFTREALEPSPDKDITTYKKHLQTLESGEVIMYMWDDDLPDEMLLAMKQDLGELTAEQKAAAEKAASGPTSVTEELEDWSFERLTLRVSHIEGIYEDEQQLAKLLGVYGRVVHLCIRLRDPSAHKEEGLVNEGRHGTSTSWALVTFSESESVRRVWDSKSINRLTGQPSHAAHADHNCMDACWVTVPGTVGPAGRHGLSRDGGRPTSASTIASSEDGEGGGGNNSAVLLDGRALNRLSNAAKKRLEAQDVGSKRWMRANQPELPELEVKLKVQRVDLAAVTAADNNSVLGVVWRSAAASAQMMVERLREADAAATAAKAEADEELQDLTISSFKQKYDEHLDKAERLAPGTGADANFPSLETAAFAAANAALAAKEKAARHAIRAAAAAAAPGSVAGTTAAAAAAAAAASPSTAATPSSVALPPVVGGGGGGSGAGGGGGGEEPLLTEAEQRAASPITFYESAPWIDPDASAIMESITDQLRPTSAGSSLSGVGRVEVGGASDEERLVAERRRAAKRQERLLKKRRQSAALMNRSGGGGGGGGGGPLGGDGRPGTAPLLQPNPDPRAPPLLVDHLEDMVGTNWGRLERAGLRPSTSGGGGGGATSPSLQQQMLIAGPNEQQQHWGSSSSAAEASSTRGGGGLAAEFVGGSRSGLGGEDESMTISGGGTSASASVLLGSGGGSPGGGSCTGGGGGRVAAVGGAVKESGTDLLSRVFELLEGLEPTLLREFQREERRRRGQSKQGDDSSSSSSSSSPPSSAGGGTLTAEQLRAALAAPTIGIELRKAEARKLLAQIDRDADGVITVAEFTEKVLAERKRRAYKAGKTPSGGGGGGGDEGGGTAAGKKGVAEAEQLQYWCVVGDVSHVELWLKKGAAIDYQDSKYGDTALIKAVMNRHPAVVQLLLRNGCDITKRNHRPGQGGTALDIAHAESTPEIQRMLQLASDALAAGLASGAHLSASERGEELWFWATEDEPDEVRALLEEKGILVDAREGTLNETALMGAASWGASRCVRLLLEKGADARLVDDNGATALHRAASQGEVEVAQALLRFAGTAALAGAHLRDKSGQTAAEVARREGQGVLAELLQRMSELATTELSADARDIDIDLAGP